MHRLILLFPLLLLLLAGPDVDAAQRAPASRRQSIQQSKKELRTSIRAKLKTIRKQSKQGRKASSEQVLWYILAGLGALVIAGLFFLLGIYLGFSMNAFLVLLAWGSGIALTVLFLIWAIRRINTM
ncbi:MAG: hypothetical protein AAF206_06530 [Bacteroidota bacterium]